MMPVYQLKTDPALCRECPTTDCLTRCQYLGLDPETAKKEKMKMIAGEDSLVLHRCATCYGCEEYCPHHNHPFYLIVKLQEDRGIKPAPEEFTNDQVKIFAPREEVKVARIEGRPLSMCLFPKLRDSRITGSIFEGTSVLMGRNFFCNLVYLHYGLNSLILERAEKTIENFARHNIDELICYHDECYALYASYAPAYGLKVPFRPVHLFEFLYRRLLENPGGIKKLGLKVAYQRPCSTRLTPEKDHYLDKIFDLIGVERVIREYDGESPLCCGAVFRAHGKGELADDVQARNIGDMVRSGAGACVFNCPMCYMILSGAVAQKGIRPVLISDLCRLALGEEAADH